MPLWADSFVQIERQAFWFQPKDPVSVDASRRRGVGRGVGAPRFQINFADNTTCHASWYFGPYAGTDQIYAARGRRARAEHFINIFNVSLPYNFPPVAPGAGAR